MAQENGKETREERGKGAKRGRGVNGKSERGSGGEGSEGKKTASLELSEGTAVVLNTAEGMYARGRSRTHSYNIALREMRESHAALEVSVRLR